MENIFKTYVEIMIRFDIYIQAYFAKDPVRTVKGIESIYAFLCLLSLFKLFRLSYCIFGYLKKK